MERKGVYTIEQVLSWVEVDEESLDKKDARKIRLETSFKKFDGVEVLSGLLGYKVFKEKGVKCACPKCETKGEYFALERTPGPGKSKYNHWHFNLYGNDKFGKEVMITKDHINPKSKGGDNELSNLQPMCISCNTKKGSSHMKEFEAKMEGRHFEWNLDHANHVIKRIKERYNLDMDLKEYKQFLTRAMHNSEVVHHVSNSKSYRKLFFKNVAVYIVYSSLYKTIYTVLDPTVIEKRLRDIPHWGKEKEKECIATYDMVLETMKKEYKTFPTDKETAEYFRGCKYPKLMFLNWKKITTPGEITFKLNTIIWSIVRCTLKLTNSNDKEEDIDMPAREVCGTDSRKTV